MNSTIVVLQTIVLLTLVSANSANSTNSKLDKNVKTKKEVQVYSLEETAALKKFRTIARSIVFNKYQQEDEYLIHFLRAKKLNVTEARTMLHRAIDWRQQNNIDKVLENKEMLKLEPIFPFKSGEAIDKEGRPALQISINEWDGRQAVRDGNLPGLRTYTAYMFEKTLAKARANNVSQIDILVDMAGFNTRKHACLLCIPIYFEATNNYEMYYPNHARHIVAINSPMLFETFLRLLRPLMTPGTKKALKVFGMNKRMEWMTYLLDIFPANQLTFQFGGTKIRLYN